MGLFATDPVRTAVLSDCGTYRYRLAREWDATKRSACFVMLNPSTADATTDDPTIRRCVGFAKAWGCGGIVVVNLFAFRATDPDAMKEYLFAVGPENDNHIRAAAIQCCPVVAAWGVHGTHKGRDKAVAELIRRAGLPWPKCLGVTKDGHPRHPLYVKADAPLVPFGDTQPAETTP